MSKSDYQITVLPPRKVAIPHLSRIWESREVLLRFGARDVTLRYRQTALGAIWVLLQPVLGAGVFSLVFGEVAKLPSGGVPYFVFSFVGLLPWNLFNSVISRASVSLVGNSSLVSKVFFPRIIVPIAVVYSAIVDFAVTLGMLVVLLFVYRINPGWPALLLPLWLIPPILLSCGAGLIFASLMVSYRDIAYVIPFLLQALLYATPIAYSLKVVPHRYLIFFNINPLTWIIEEFRWSLLGQAAPHLFFILLSFVVSLIFFLIGVLIFESRDRIYADVI